jgi:hypothetical protein
MGLLALALLLLFVKEPKKKVQGKEVETLDFPLSD